MAPGPRARMAGADIAQFDGMGSGLVASRTLDTEDEVLLVPRPLWFTRKTAHTRYTPLVDQVNDTGVFSHSMSRLALLLALERADPGSFFRAYLDALGPPTVPYTLTPEERAACQGLPLVEWIDEQHATTRKEVGRIVDALRSLGHESALDTDTWRWAYGHVMQRTFSVDLDDEEVWVLVPGMDLCNHSTAPNTRYFAEDEGWLLEAAHPIPEGEQLTIHYGTKKTSCDLLLYYGFVPLDNPNDLVHLHLRLPDADPDRAEKEAAIEVLGLQTDALVGADGVIPSAFLHAAILWGLDTRAFHAPQPDVHRPEHAVAALDRIADALEKALAAHATSIEEDDALRTDGLAGWQPSIVAYRRNVKSVLRHAAHAVRSRIDEIRAGGWDPTDAVAPDHEGRYGLQDVSVFA